MNCRIASSVCGLVGLCGTLVVEDRFALGLFVDALGAAEG